MTNKEFVALGKRLLPELPGFRVRRQLLFMSPIGHILRGIFFDRSIDPRAFYVQIVVQPLYVPQEHIVFNFCWRLGGRSWSADDSDIVTKLSAAIRREAVPFLSDIQSPRDIPSAAQALRTPGDPNIRRAIAYSLARADEKEKAIAALEEFLREMRPLPWPDWLYRDAERAKLLLEDVRQDSAVAQRRLELWENETRKNLSLEGLA